VDGGQGSRQLGVVPLGGVFLGPALVCGCCPLRAGSPQFARPAWGHQGDDGMPLCGAAPTTAGSATGRWTALGLLAPLPS